MKRYFTVALIGAVACLTACMTTTTSNWTRNESPSDAAKYNALLGLEYMKRGELVSARDRIEAALKADPNMPVAHTAAGMLYDRLAEPERAAKHFRTAIRLQNDDPELLNHFGVFLCRQNKIDEGEAMILKAANTPIYATPYLAYTNAGLCMSGAGRQAEAEKYFLKALEIRPSYTSAISQLAEMKFSQHDNLQARAYLERYIKASRNLEAPDPDLPAMLWLGVRVERALDNPSTAEAYARRLKSEYPKADQTRALLKSENSTG